MSRIATSGTKFGIGSGRRQREVERAELDALDRLALGAERAGIEILDLVAAVGARLDLAREGVDRDAVVRVLGDRDVHLERRLRERGRCRQGERDARPASASAAEEAGNAHGVSPGSVRRAAACAARRPERRILRTAPQLYSAWPSRGAIADGRRTVAADRAHARAVRERPMWNNRRSQRPRGVPATRRPDHSAPSRCSTPPSTPNSRRSCRRPRC